MPRSLPQELWSSLLPLSVGKGLLDDAEPSSETTVAEPPRRANTDALRELALGAVVVLDYAPRLLAANLLGRVLSRAALVCLHAAPDGITSATTTTTITTTLAAAGRTVLSGLEGGWAVANAVLAGALRLALALPLLPRLLFATLWLEAKLKAWGAAIVTRAFDSVDAFAVTSAGVGSEAPSVAAAAAAAAGHRHTRRVRCAMDVLVAPLAEETTHRGIIQGGITRLGRAVCALGSSSAAVVVATPATSDTTTSDIEDDDSCEDSSNGTGALSTMLAAIPATATMCARVLGAACFASLHSAAGPVAAALPPSAASLASSSSPAAAAKLFGSPHSVVLAQRRLGLFVMSLLVYSPLAQRRAATAKSKRQQLQPQGRRPAPFPLPLPRLPLAAVGAHACWNAVCWTPPARVLNGLGDRVLLWGRPAFRGRFGGVDALVGAAVAFEAGAWASRWIAAEATERLNLPLRLPCLLPQQDSPSTTTAGEGARPRPPPPPPRLKPRPPPYVPPWFRCARPLSRPFFAAVLVAFALAGGGS